MRFLPIALLALSASTIASADALPSAGPTTPARDHMTWPDKNCDLRGIAQAIAQGHTPVECWTEDSQNRRQRNGTGKSEENKKG